jgi:pyroglutamyl-peptidase
MHTIAANPELRHTRGGFVHVPWLPGQGTPNMALDDVVRGLRVAVRAALGATQDTPLAAGATH